MVEGLWNFSKNSSDLVYLPFPTKGSAQKNHVFNCLIFWRKNVRFKVKDPPIGQNPKFCRRLFGRLLLSRRPKTLNSASLHFKVVHLQSQFTSPHLITHQAGNWNLKSYTHIIHFQGMTCILLSNLISSDALGFLIVLIRRSNFAAVNRVPNVIVI